MKVRFLLKSPLIQKNYWNYPDEYYEIWKKELTITQDYISKNDVYVYEQNN